MPAMQLTIGRAKPRAVSTFAEASAYFRSRIGARGASTMPDGILTDAAGKPVARISYNGRVWPPEAWTPGQQPLWSPPSDAP